jgi:hypothetical protein
MKAKSTTRVMILVLGLLGLFGLLAAPSALAEDFGLSMYTKQTSPPPTTSNRTCLNSITCNGGSQCSSALACVGSKVGADCGNGNTCNVVCQNTLAACCGCSRATTTMVESFTAVADAGNVMIEMAASGLKTGTLFNVYRSNAPGEDFIRVNAEPFSSQGQTTPFKFADEPGDGTFEYVVEMVDGNEVTYGGSGTVNVIGDPKPFTGNELVNVISNRTCLPTIITCTDGTTCGGALACNSLKVGQSCGGNRTCNEICHATLGACCGCSSATSYEVSVFSGEIQDNEVVLTWKTAAEAVNGSFNIYRSLAPGDVMVRLNESVIKALGDGKGAEYQFSDDLGSKTQSYLLEAVEADGSKILTGPIDF